MLLGLKLLISRDLVLAFSLGFWISGMSFFFILLLFNLVRYDEFVLGVVNALIKGEIEDQWWSPLDDEC